MSAAWDHQIKPYHQTDRFSLYEGDCRSVLPIFANCSVDSVVCDPPYELGFMGKGWDRSGIAYDVEVWRECLRVLKPGGHLLAFGGSRTYHRLACAIEDAGFEIRDQIQWIYGSGFPKSLDVSKAIDAASGAEREIVGVKGTAPDIRGNSSNGNGISSDASKLKDRLPNTITVAATDAAKQWNGWGTALKPAHEPLVLARKPLIGTVAENVLQHGTGGLNIDGCRIEFQGNGDGEWTSTPGRGTQGQADKGTTGIYGYFGGDAEPKDQVRYESNGRWPANVIHDGSEEVLAGFPNAESGWTDRDKTGRTPFVSCDVVGGNHYSDNGSAARFFYCAKASQEDRNEGCEDLELKAKFDLYGDGLNSATKLDPKLHTAEGVACRPLTRNPHPTVKPTDLMRYLCRLITPPGGLVLDPFCGSGSTGKAAMLEGLKFIGIELNAGYCELAQRRIEAVTKQGLLFA
jgi:DNA modification methylase